MELLDRYLQAVRFWLPKAQQEDIIAELSSDLHSQIDDREVELGHPLDNTELEVILRRRGSPILVASRYRPQTQLIGPALFPIYLFVLKVTLLWILVPVFVVIVGPVMIVGAANRVGAVLQTLSTLSTAVFLSAATITVVFAVLERTQAKLNLFEKWSLRSLPPAPKVAQPSSRTHTIFELIVGFSGLLWLLALPQYPFLVLGPFAAFLKPAPVWHNFYVPVLLLCCAGLAHQFVSLMRPQWNWLAPAARLLTTVLGLAIVNYLINAAGAPHSSDWHPYIVVADSVAHSVANSPQKIQQLSQVAAWVNVSVLITLVVTWFGFSIAGIIQVWQLMRHFNNRVCQTRDAALLSMLF